MHLSLLDIIVAVFYVAALLTVSYFFTPDGPDKTGRADDKTAAPRTLTWWAIGTSLIAANISAEQIIGMSGSAYAFGMAVASYEWIAALALLIAGKFFLPVFLKNGIHTMPEFLRRRFGTRIQLVMATFWLTLYVFINLTAVLWLGATAVHAVTGLTMTVSLILLGLFAGNYALYSGLRPTSIADVMQVAVLVLGSLAVVYIALERISGGTGLLNGIDMLTRRLPDHFHMVLQPDNPFYKYAPGVAMVAGGMWIINLSYWGFNQNIIQNALAAGSIRAAQKGVVLAAFLKLLIPILVVLPGIAAILLVGGIARPDQAYPQLMTTLPSGLRGLVFVALMAAMIASMGSILHSIADIFTHDILKAVRSAASNRLMAIAGRFVTIAALAAAMLATFPLLDHIDQAFQFIQEYAGVLTPGVLVIFLCGLFWKRANETGALAAAFGTVAVSIAFKILRPELPFINRIEYVFLVCLALTAAASLLRRPQPQTAPVDLAGVDYSTPATYNIAGLFVVAVLAAIYAIWW
jgi:solute:Na+ symporter, SSS family